MILLTVSTALIDCGPVFFSVEKMTVVISMCHAWRPVEAEAVTAARLSLKLCSNHHDHDTHIISQHRCRCL